MVWWSKVPSRVAFFSWTVALGKILTISNLWKRCMLILDWCCMCKKCGETVDHLLLHCPIALELWNVVFCLFGLHWVMPMTVIHMFMFSAWQGSFGKHRNISFWKVVPHCIIWYLWQERNSRSFEGCEWNILEIKAFFLLTLLDWSAAIFSPLVFLSYTCLIIVFWLDCTSLLVHCWCTRFGFF